MVLITWQPPYGDASHGTWYANGLNPGRGDAAQHARVLSGILRQAGKGRAGLRTQPQRSSAGHALAHAPSRHHRHRVHAHMQCAEPHGIGARGAKRGPH